MHSELQNKVLQTNATFTKKAKLSSKKKLRTLASFMVPELVLNVLFTLLLVKQYGCFKAEHKMLNESGGHTWLKYYLRR